MSRVYPSNLVVLGELQDGAFLHIPVIPAEIFKGAEFTPSPEPAKMIPGEEVLFLVQQAGVAPGVTGTVAGDLGAAGVTFSNVGGGSTITRNN